jgi:hypothetical protein
MAIQTYTSAKKSGTVYTHICDATPRSAYGTCYRTELQLAQEQTMAMRYGRRVTTEAAKIRNLRLLDGYKTPDETESLHFNRKSDMTVTVLGNELSLILMPMQN